jgi:hypothetical protein
LVIVRLLERQSETRWATVRSGGKRGQGEQDQDEEGDGERRVGDKEGRAVDVGRTAAAAELAARQPMSSPSRSALSLQVSSIKGGKGGKT